MTFAFRMLVSTGRLAMRTSSQLLAISSPLTAGARREHRDAYDVAPSTEHWAVRRAPCAV